MHTARRGSHDSDDRRKHRSLPAAPGSLGQRHRHHDPRRGGRGTRSRRPRHPACHRLPARQAGRRGLVEGRPRDERHDGRRGPAPASVPGHPGRGDHPRRRAVHPRRAARGRHLGHLLRRPRRTVHDHRGLRRPPPGRRLTRGAPHGAGRGVDQVPRRHRLRPGLHPDLAGPVRLVEVGRPARTPAGADLLPHLGPAQHLRLRLLGPADHRAAHHRLREAAGASRAVPAGRTAHRPGPPQPATPPGTRGQLGRRLPAHRQGPARLPQGRPARCAGPR